MKKLTLANEWKFFEKADRGDVFTVSQVFMASDVYRLAKKACVEVEYCKPGTPEHKEHSCMAYKVTGVNVKTNEELQMDILKNFIEREGEWGIHRAIKLMGICQKVVRGYSASDLLHDETIKKILINAKQSDFNKGLIPVYEWAPTPQGEKEKLVQTYNGYNIYQSRQRDGLVITKVDDTSILIEARISLQQAKQTIDDMRVKGNE